MLFWKNKLGLRFPVSDKMLTRQVWGALASCSNGIKVGNGQRKVPNGPVCVNPFCYHPDKDCIKVMKPMLETFEVLGLLTDPFILQVLSQMGWDQAKRDFAPSNPQFDTPEFRLKGFELIAAKVRQFDFESMYAALPPPEEKQRSRRGRSDSPLLDDPGYVSNSSSTPPHMAYTAGTAFESSYGGAAGAELGEFEADMDAFDSLEQLLQEGDDLTDLHDLDDLLPSCGSPGTGADYGGDTHITSGLMLPPIAQQLTAYWQQSTMCTTEAAEDASSLVVYGDIQAQHGDSMVMRGVPHEEHTCFRTMRSLSEDSSGVVGADAAFSVDGGLKHGDVVVVVRGQGGDGKASPIRVMPFGATEAKGIVGVLAAGSGANADRDVVCRRGLVKVSVHGAVERGATLYATQGTSAVAARGRGDLKVGVALASSPVGAGADDVHSIFCLVAIPSVAHVPRAERNVLLARAHAVTTGALKQDSASPRTTFRRFPFTGSESDFAMLDESVILLSLGGGALEAREGQTTVSLGAESGSSAWFVLHSDMTLGGSNQSVLLQSVLDDSRWLSTADDGTVIVVNDPSSPSSHWKFDPRPDGTLRLVGEAGAVGFGSSGKAICTDDNFADSANFQLHLRH